jgi:hypothetical protein
MSEKAEKKDKWIFQVKDFNAIRVNLSRLTWETKAGNGNIGSHPEIRNYLDDIKELIRFPDLVFESTKDKRSKIFYKLNAGRGVFNNKHLVVVVKYVQEQNIVGYISTMYLSRSVYTKGKVLWMSSMISKNISM